MIETFEFIDINNLPLIKPEKYKDKEKLTIDLLEATHFIIDYLIKQLQYNNKICFSKDFNNIRITIRFHSLTVKPYCLFEIKEPSYISFDFFDLINSFVPLEHLIIFYSFLRNNIKEILFHIETC